MKNPIIIAIVAASILFQSCASVLPTTPNIVIPQKKGEINVHASVGTPAHSVGGSIALTDNVAVVANANFVNDDFGKRRSYEAGVQLSKFISPKTAISVTPTIGFGTTKQDFIQDYDLLKLAHPSNSSFQSLFFQSQFFTVNEKDKKFSIATGCRFALTQAKYNEFSLDPVSSDLSFGNKTSIEPVLALVGQKKSVGFFLIGMIDLVSLSTTNNWLIYRDPIILSAGINFKIGQ